MRLSYHLEDSEGRDGLNSVFVLSAELPLKV